MTIGATNTSHHPVGGKLTGKSENAHIASNIHEDFKKKNLFGGKNSHLTPMQQNISVFS